MTGPRIGYLVSLYPAASHTFIRREVEELRRRGLEIHTFSVRRSADDELLSEEDRREAANTYCILAAGPPALLAANVRAASRRPAGYFRLLWMSLRHRIPGARSLLWSLFYLWESILLAAELERRGIRHLHSHFANAGGVVGLLATQWLGIGWSLTLHGSADLGAATQPLLAGKIARASFVACASHFVRSQAMYAADPDDWSKIFLCHCGMDPSRLRATDRGRASRRRTRILSVGRLAAEKAQIGLLEAFAAALDRGLDAELVIVGEGTQRGRLESRVDQLGLGGCCRLLGSLSENEVFAQLAEADVFTLSSLVEGLPVVLMEALAAGLPVVAPRLAGIPELVAHGRNGLLYPPGDWNALTECLVQLLRDEELRTRLGNEGPGTTLPEFAIDRAVEPLVERFRRVE